VKPKPLSPFEKLQLKYPHWGWDANKGLLCAFNNNTGCNTHWEDGQLVEGPWKPDGTPTSTPTSTSTSTQMKTSTSTQMKTSTSTPTPTLQIPSWVQGDPLRSKNGTVRASGKWNATLVTDANKAHKKFNVVLYGDSITAFAASKHLDIWERYLGRSAAPLGVGGDTVQSLSWRIAKGRERLSRPPGNVAVLIGVNNILHDTDPVVYMDEFLLPYLKAIYPTSNIIIIGLLPTTRKSLISTSDVNKGYKRLAKKYNVRYVDISRGLDASNPRLFYDGLHPSAAGYDIMFRNLQKYV